MDSFASASTSLLGDRIRFVENILIRNKEFAEKYRSEIRLETDNIKVVYDAVKETYPELRHPDLKIIKRQPW